jgi:hypothetical protein
MSDLGVPDAVQLRDRLRRITARDIVEKTCSAAFGKPLVVNYLRSMLVEAMIDVALAPDWEWVSGDWAGWDFQKDGVKLEVKQSAALQTWTTKAPSRGTFDIARRTGHWIGNEWNKGLRRYGDIYIFARHPVSDRQGADHRNPHQWRFYVVSETSLVLANQKTITLSAVERLVSSVGFEEVARKVDEVMAELTKRPGG